MNFLAKLDGRTKLISIVAITLFMFTFKNYWQYLLITGIFILIFFGQLRLNQRKQIVKHWKLILILPSLNLIVNSFFINGKVIWSWWRLHITRLDLAIFWRLILLLLFALTFSTITNPSEMALAIGKIINSLTLGYYQGSGIVLVVIIMAAFIREFGETWQTVIQAAKLRTIPSKSFQRWSDLIAPIWLLQPLILISLKKADRVADALIAHGYHQDAKLFDYRKQKYHLNDWIIYGSLVLFIIINNLILGKL